MFIPTVALVNEAPLKTVNDCIEALEMHVLPRYPNEITKNVSYTKTQCFRILMSYFTAGKLNPMLSPIEVEKAVEKFMDERLWVTPEEFKNTQILLTDMPSAWFTYPLTTQVKDITILWFSLVIRLYQISAITFKLLLTDLIRLGKLIVYRTGFRK